MTNLSLLIYTPRQLQVIMFIILGYTSGEIACELGIKISTVAGFVQQIRDIMNVNNIASIVRVALDTDFTHTLNEEYVYYKGVIIPDGR